MATTAQNGDDNDDGQHGRPGRTDIRTDGRPGRTNGDERPPSQASDGVKDDCGAVSGCRNCNVRVPTPNEVVFLTSFADSVDTAY